MNKLFILVIPLLFPFSLRAADWLEINQQLLDENWPMVDQLLSEKYEQSSSEQEKFNILLNRTWAKLNMGLPAEAANLLRRTKRLDYKGTELEEMASDDTEMAIKLFGENELPEFEDRITIDGGHSRIATSYWNDNLDAITTWVRTRINEFLSIEERNSLFIEPVAPTLVRGEFEKPAKFLERVSQAQSAYKKAVTSIVDSEKEIKQQEDKKAQQKQDFVRQAQRLYMQAALKESIGVLDFDLLTYNAEQEYFPARIKSRKGSESFSTLTIAIDEPINSAKVPGFKSNLANGKPFVIFQFSEAGIKLDRVLLKMPDNSLRSARLVKDDSVERVVANYQVPEIDVKQVTSLAATSFQSIRGVTDIVLNSIKPEIERLKAELTTAELNNDSSAIDRLNQDIAQFESSLQEYFDDDLPGLLEESQLVASVATNHAIVVGINQYAHTARVEFADRSAELFAKIAEHRLGVPEENIITLLNENATGSNIKTRINFIARNLGPSDKLYFFFAGHGIPSQQQGGEPYLLAYDMSPGFASEEKDMQLSNIWKILTQANQGEIIAFVDSCFSGNADNKLIFEGVAPGLLRRKSLDQKLADNLLVFTAGNESQFANYYPEKGHRLFSYFLLRGIIEGINEPDELASYLQTKVGKVSTRNGPVYRQVPQMMGSYRGKL
jgi:hypothetical protein